MSSTIKTAAIAGTIAFAVCLFAVQAAHAGGRHHRIPFMPFDAYAASADAYDDDTAYYGEDRHARYGSDVDDAVSAARGLARDYLDADLDEVLDLVGE
jgi:hypothetical protein